MLYPKSCYKLLCNKEFQVYFDTIFRIRKVYMHWYVKVWSIMMCYQKYWRERPFWSMRGHWRTTLILGWCCCMSIFLVKGSQANVRYCKAWIILHQAKKKKMHVSGLSSEKTRYGWLALSFYFIDIFYIESAFITTFFSIFDNILLTIHSKMLRVGKRETHIYFFFFGLRFKEVQQMWFLFYMVRRFSFIVIIS